MDRRILELARRDTPLAVELLRAAIRVPADWVDRPAEEGGDPACGLSNHEGPRLELLRRRVLELGAVDGSGDVGFDAFGNLWWRVEDPDDGVAAADKVVILLDGHTDTVKALRERWHEAIGGGIDPYLGLVDPVRIDRTFLRRELGHLPADEQWEHLVWGRGSADQLGGVVCQVFATRILRELRAEGALRGAVVWSYATVAEEDNDGGGPMYVMRHALAGAGAERIPDLVVLTEGTGSAAHGALGIYRGQRGRMQIEVEVVGKSCHGSMPWEGRNPLEHGAAILVEARDRYERGEGFRSDPFLGAGSRTASFATLDTPSDCAVPERFTFRFDRRLTAAEDPDGALGDVERLEAVGRAREAGLQVSVRVPCYEQPTWRGYVPGNAQIYPGWVTPADHPTLAAAAEAYRRTVTPWVESAGGGAVHLRREPRIDRWVFSTDGVGVPLVRGQGTLEVPPQKRWVEAGALHHPAMFGIGPGFEENTHKIGECLDARELTPVIAFLARLPSLVRR
jgi:acetylornithine deacetylase/succinyl-diaminopimelate desuccinylase-like protein